MPTQFCSGSISKFWDSVLRKVQPTTRPPVLLNRPRLDADPENAHPVTSAPRASAASAFTNVNSGVGPSAALKLTL